MIVGLGLDLCDTPRIDGMLTRWGTRFSARVFTASERSYCDSKACSAQHYAARFAAKEAALKALGVPSGLSWHEMEVAGGGGGPPALVLHGKALDAAKALGASEFHLTLTHAGDFAAAVVVLERRA